MKKFLLTLLISFLFQSTFASVQCFSTTLKEGSAGSEVGRVQDFIKKDLFLDFPTTNFFGPITRQAVISFQEKYSEDILLPLSLSQGTGIWGAYTYTKANALCVLPTNSTDTTPTTPQETLTGENIIFGQQNDQIRALQEFLNKEINAGLPLTGYFGPMTQEAVKLFQEKYRDEILTPNGLETGTGYFGPSTKMKILQLSNPPKKETIPVQNNPKPIIHTSPRVFRGGGGGGGSSQILAPVNTVLPVISGTTTVGSTLSTTDGTWTGNAITYSYQWLRDGVAISGATSATYLLVSDDQGTDASVTVTATNTGGANSATSSTTTISLNAPVNTILPVISGTTTVGSTLSTTDGTWTGNAITYSYQWLRDGVAISGATSATYLLVSDDQGTDASVTVTATNTGGANSATSSTTTISLNAPVNTILPVISGTTTVGSTLSTTDGTWTGNAITYSYQWLRDGVAISGATSATYILTYLDFGKQITARVTATNIAGNIAATSAPANSITYSFLPVSSIAFVGDSITTQMTGGDAYGTGHAVSARIQTGSLFDFYPNPNTGTIYFAQGGSQTSLHLSTFIPQALAAGAKVIVYHGGTNDISGGSDVTAAVLANIESMINLAINNGAIMVLTPVLGPSSVPGNAQKSGFTVTLNNGIQALATQYNMPFADWRTLTEASPGVSNLGILYDNLHPSEFGGWQMGAILADTLMPYLNTNNLNTFWANIENGTYGELVPINNYKFTSVSGNTPTGYSLNLGTCSGCSASQSIVSRADGNGNWWQINLTNPSPTTNKIFFKDTIVRRHSALTASATSSTITLNASAVASADFYKDHRIWIISGTGAGQTRKITAYSAARVATIDVAWVTLPDSTSQYVVGFRNGERVQFFAEMEFDTAAEIHGLSGNYRMVDQFPSVKSGEFVNSEPVTSYVWYKPTRTIVFRGPISTVANYYDAGSGFFSQLQYYFGGSGILRVGRVGVIGLDRYSGQLTFTP